MRIQDTIDVSSADWSLVSPFSHRAARCIAREGA